MGLKITHCNSHDDDGTLLMLKRIFGEKLIRYKEVFAARRRVL